MFSFLGDTYCVYYIYIYTLPGTKIAPKILVSLWNGRFVVTMLVSGRVYNMYTWNPVSFFGLEVVKNSNNKKGVRFDSNILVEITQFELNILVEITQSHQGVLL